MSRLHHPIAWILAVLVPIGAAEARPRAQNEGALPEPATYQVTRATGPIKVDARLDEPAWQNALRLEL
ncbi:MAG TPA: hypothetical protein PKL08_17465, partial [Thermoanaerobaculaceae bacterium]|nr:hypothetical protein [Thermoanaerobaculaceae bacterium]